MTHRERLLKVLRGETPADWRKTHYYHYYESGGHGVALHYGVTDGRYKLIRFPEPEVEGWEFYDLESNPLELESRYGDPALAEEQARMKGELDRLRAKYEVPDR